MKVTALAAVGCKPARSAGVPETSHRLTLSLSLSFGVPHIGIDPRRNDKKHPALLEPVREISIHGEAFAASRLSMMRIMARRKNAATVVA